MKNQSTIEKHVNKSYNENVNKYDDYYKQSLTISLEKHPITEPSPDFSLP